MEITNFIVAIMASLIILLIELGVPILITYLIAALSGQAFSWLVVFVGYVIIQVFLNTRVAYSFLNKEKK